MWLSYQDFGMTFIFDYGTKRLERIIVTTPTLLVEDTGIHVGSPRADVLRFLGKPPADKASEMDYPQRGIKFFIGGPDAVTAIEIRKREAGSLSDVVPNGQ